MKPQLLAGEGTLKGLEPPQCEEFDAQNYSVGNQKEEIEGDSIVEENYPRIVRNRCAPLYCQIMLLIYTITCCLPCRIFE